MPRPLSLYKKRKIVRMKAAGNTAASIAHLTGMAESTVWRTLKEWNENTDQKVEVTDLDQPTGTDSVQNVLRCNLPDNDKVKVLGLLLSEQR